MNTDTKRPRGIYLLPNLFTIGCLFAGFFAIVSSLKGDYGVAAISIFLAMLMDALDGRVARLTNTMTAFGAQFDSMADMVSFAVAPAFLAYAWGLHNLGKFGLISAFIYAVAVALRLARFNAQIHNIDKRYFQGLSCPPAAAVVSSLIWICVDYGITNKVMIVTVALAMILLGALMVSNIRYRSFKDVELKRSVRFVVILIIVSIVALISIDPEKILFVIFVGYAVSGPTATIWGLQQKKRQRKQLHKHE